MHLKVIACEVLAREVYHCAAKAVNTTDITVLTQGLHDNPEVMRDRLQAEIHAASDQRFDAIVLGYGLCNNGMAGVCAESVPLVVPKAHDCITLLLGSKDRYAEDFAERPGTYYYSSGWIEYESREGERVSYTPASGLAKRLALMEYIEKYGEDNGRYLFEQMTQWEVHYTHGVFIGFPFTAHLALEEKVQAICREKGWIYQTIEGNLALIQDSLDGGWDDDQFLTVRPGHHIEAEYNDEIMQYRQCGGCGQ